MLKSHQWAHIIEARCPYCHKYDVVRSTSDDSEGCFVKCNHCRQLFILSKRTIKDIIKNVRRVRKSGANGERE
ncbi:hypothetical protein LCGC14_0377910 [marine sediment metagenome]|uniref:Uncharacterized protein n=1 Tax=marine sediment metagenome TaxID=412755 RepID=A0A0F9WBV4_9ZZZZ